MSDLMFTPGPHLREAPPIQTNGPVKSWSFSSLTKFEQCPYAIYLSKVEGLKEPAGPAAERGHELHETLERYVRGEAVDLPPKVAGSDRMLAFVDGLREAYVEGCVEVEQEWTFDKFWVQCEPQTPDVWAVFKCDAVLHESDTCIRIIDWKSGKIFGNELKHGTQGMFYCIAALLRYPKANFVQAEFAYIDHGQTSTRCVLTRDELQHFLPRLTKRALNMTQAHHFPANPSKQNCRWCRYKDEVMRENGQPACEWGVV